MKLLYLFILLAGAAALFAFVAQKRDKHAVQPYSWAQKSTIGIETPEGPIEESAVQRVSVRYYPVPPIMTDTERSYQVTGDILTVDLGEGRVLVVMSRKPELTEAVFRDMDAPGDRGAQFAALVGQAGTGPRDYREPYMPILALFADAADPMSIVEVDPDDLAARLGPGYALRRLDVEITDEPPTTGKVRALFPWFDNDPRPFWYLSGDRCTTCYKYKPMTEIRSTDFTDQQEGTVYSKAYRLD